MTVPAPALLWAWETDWCQGNRLVPGKQTVAKGRDWYQGNRLVPEEQTGTRVKDWCQGKRLVPGKQLGNRSTIRKAVNRMEINIKLNISEEKCLMYIKCSLKAVKMRQENLEALFETLDGNREILLKPKMVIASFGSHGWSKHYHKDVS